MDRINDTTGTGFRANAGDFGASASFADRGSFGSEQNPSGTPGQSVLSSQMSGNPHSSRGFRRALMKSQRTQSGTLKGDIADRVHSGGKGFKKPNYFAQGGKRHGMHIGSGAPFTGASDQSGSDIGGE
jgi:hypothetical protein